MSSTKILCCGMLLILCLISASLAQDELKDMTSPNEQEELLEDIQELLHSVQSMLDQTNNKTGPDNGYFGCRCSGLHCKCCRLIRIRRLGFNRYCCLNVWYLRRRVGFLVTLTLGSRTLFRKEISVRNPIPICVRVPFLRRAASVCIQLTNVGLGSSSVHACVALSARLFSVTIARFSLGCYNIRFCSDQQMEPANALEPTPFYGDWIGTQEDPAVPDFEDHVDMVDSVGRHPLLGRSDAVLMMTSMEEQTSMENGDVVMFANIEKSDIDGDVV